MRQGDQDVADAKVQQMCLEVVAQRQHSNGCRHLGLHRHGNVENKLLAFLHRSRVQDQSLVAVRAGGKVPQCRDRVALNLLVVGGPQEVDQGAQKVGFDNGGLVQRVDRNVAYAGDGRQNQRQV